MATRRVAGIFRSDTSLDGIGAFTPGNTFSSDLITQIEVDLGADDTVFDGDEEPTNEVANDQTQTYDDGDGPKAFAYDFTIELEGSDGEIYQMVVFDYDINNDGDFGDGDIGGQDADENNYFMAFTGALPPPGITLTTTDRFTDNSTSLPIESVIICFGAGALIETPGGLIPVEDLQNGDLVLTQDNGAQPIRWIGSTTLDAIDLAVKPILRPVMIRAGALGEGYPSQDLIVSRQHRILVRSTIAQRMFGEDEVLIPAAKLLEVDGVEVMNDMPDGVEYFHILFDEHQIVRANGALTESLFTGPEALNAVSPEARAEIEALFPEICGPDFKPVAARHIPESGKRMKKLVQRHLSNDKPLYVN